LLDSCQLLSPYAFSFPSQKQKPFSSQMNADDGTINLIWDRAAYRFDTYPAPREWVCPASSGYPDTGHNKKIFICVHLGPVLIRFYLRQKAYEVSAPSELTYLTLSFSYPRRSRCGKNVSAS
jgi:hypothetical protein